MTLLERVLDLLRLWRQLLDPFAPIAGGDGDDDDDGDDSDDSDDSDDDTDSDDADDDDDEDDDQDTVPKSEVDKLSRRLAETQKKLRAAEKQRKKAEEKKAADEGKWKELAEEREREKEKAEAELAKAKTRSAVEKVAKRLGFADPDDATRFLDAEDLDAEDENAIERELKDVLEAKPHLKAEDGDGQRPVRTRRRNSGKPDMDKLIRGRAGRG